MIVQFIEENQELVERPAFARTMSRKNVEMLGPVFVAD
jgi:hypothetical protein